MFNKEASTKLNKHFWKVFPVIEPDMLNQTIR